MKNEELELLKSMINDLFGMEELHQEYQDNDIHFVVDSLKDGNKLTVTVELIKDEEKETKQEFESWLEGVDDDLFSEILDKIREEDDLFDLECVYNSKDYKKAISKVKSTAEELIKEKISNLEKLIFNIGR